MCIDTVLVSMYDATYMKGENGSWKNFVLCHVFVHVYI